MFISLKRFGLAVAMLGVLAAPAQAGPKIYSGSLVFHALGNDLTTGTTSPFATYTFLALPLGAFFGAMEVMVPVMTTGMVAGMLVSMAATMQEVTLWRGAEVGAMSGIATLMACYVANALIRGRAARWTS